MNARPNRHSLAVSFWGAKRPTYIEAWDGPLSVASWESAYQRFETVEQETLKFERRLLQLGAGSWAPQSDIVELFCGRGSGLSALKRLGFDKVQGLDLSIALLRSGAGHRLVAGDSRSLPFASSSRDILIVQGGLHHLAVLPGDLERVLSEVQRVLTSKGRLVVVEPWMTPFLALVHCAASFAVVRRLVPKVDAFATMVRHERPTYEQWLTQPREIVELLEEKFEVEFLRTRWGKLSFVGRHRA